VPSDRANSHRRFQGNAAARDTAARARSPRLASPRLASNVEGSLTPVASQSVPASYVQCNAMTVALAPLAWSHPATAQEAEHSHKDVSAIPDTPELAPSDIVVTGRRQSGNQHRAAASPRPPNGEPLIFLLNAQRVSGYEEIWHSARSSLSRQRPWRQASSDAVARRLVREADICAGSLEEQRPEPKRQRRPSGRRL